MPQEQPSESPWTWFDDTLLYSCHVVAALRAGRPEAITVTIATAFAPTLGDEERLLAHGDFILSECIAPGDGTYTHDSGFFFATGGAGLALTGVVAGARALGNASRRRQAQQAAIPRWMQVDRGSIFVGTHGFYLQSGLGHRAWGWSGITMADMVGPDQVYIVGETNQGHQVNWVIASPWAPLLFALWCLARHQQHPRFRSNAWLPPGWWERALVAGRRPAIDWPH